MALFGSYGAGVHIPGTNINIAPTPDGMDARSTARNHTSNPLGLVVGGLDIKHASNATALDMPQQISTAASTQVVPDSNPNPSPTPDAVLGSGDGSKFTDTSAARGVTLGELASLDDILARALAEAQRKYDVINQGYDAEDATNQSRYNEQVSTNEQTREAQRQAALLAAAQGARGLYSTLASIGALGGTGRVLANRAVANEANADIGASDKTFGANAKTLFNTFSDLKTQEEQRRRDADAALAADQNKARFDTADSRQSLYKDLASLWTQAGNNSEAATALANAGAQTAIKTANSPSPSSVAGYARAPLQFSAPALKSYLGGANDMTVSTSGAATPINGAIYTSTKKRDNLS